jgi:PAS domain S-box-containing protein
MSNLSEAQKNNLYQEILDHAMECIWAFDLTNREYLYISPSVHQLRGLSVAEALEETFEDSLTPDSLQKIRNSALRRFKRFMDGDRSHDIVNEVAEFEQYCKNGTTITMEISTHLHLLKETGSLVIIGVSRDITRRKQYEKKMLQQLRQQKRTSTECAAPPLTNKPVPQVNFFGKFKVLAAGSTLPVKWRTSKVEELLAYLLSKDRPEASKAEICEALWPDADAEKSATYLHNTLYHLKKDLKKAQIAIDIQLINGSYYYRLPDIHSDLGELKSLVHDTIIPFAEFDDVSAAAVKRGIALYRGDYLTENGYLWALPKAAHYRKQFEDYALSLARYYFYKLDYPACKNVLFQMIKVDNLNEKIHELLLKVYILENDYESFLTYYDYLKDLLQSELDVSPSQTIQNMYQNYHAFAAKCRASKTAHF